MIANDVAVEQCHLSSKLLKQDSQNLGGGRFSGRTKASEPDAETLLVPRWVRVSNGRADFRSREPGRQFSASIAIPLPHTSARELGGDRMRRDVVDVFVAIFLR